MGKENQLINEADKETAEKNFIKIFSYSKTSKLVEENKKTVADLVRLTRNE